MYVFLVILHGFVHGGLCYLLFWGALLIRPLSVGDLLSILFSVPGLDLVVLFLLVCCGASCSVVFHVWFCSGSSVSYLFRLFYIFWFAEKRQNTKRNMLNEMGTLASKKQNKGDILMLTRNIPKAAEKLDH